MNRCKVLVQYIKECLLKSNKIYALALMKPELTAFWNFDPTKSVAEDK